MFLYLVGCVSFRVDNEYIGFVCFGWMKIVIVDVIELIKNGDWFN